MDVLSNAQWIWCGTAGENVNQYAALRTVFNAGSTDAAQLFISADWDFVVKVNGVEIGRGQFPDYPDKKTVSRFEISNLNVGKNVISVEAYVPGDDFLAMMKGRPGVIAAVIQNDRTLCVTGENWKAVQHPEFTCGEIEKVTVQLGFSALRDLRKAEDFANLDFDDSNWKNAVLMPRENCVLSMRPLPPIVLGGALGNILTGCGKLRRDVEKETFALTVDADIYDPEKNANGQYMVYDFGVESTGYIDIDLKNAAEGTVVDVTWGEYLKDGHPRARIGERNFTVRFICRRGTNHLELPFLRLGCRYIQLSITGEGAENVIVKYAGMRDFSLSLPSAARFESSFSGASRLREIGLRTLQCCMHFHYEDCPWREQGLYAYDSRNQIIFGYYAWGNYDFVRASLDLLGSGYQPRVGEINMCAPNNYPEPGPRFSYGAISSFTRVWIVELMEYVLYSGDISLAHKFSNQLEVMLDKFMEKFDAEHGLFRLNDAYAVWNFFEWVPELEQLDASCCDFHILHNCYTLEAIKAAAACLRFTGKNDAAVKWEKFADQLGKNIEEHFYDPEAGCYASRLKDGVFTGKRHAHCQFMMLAMQLVPESRRADIAWKIENSNDLVHFTFSPLPYYIRGMFNADAAARQAALRRIDLEYMAMADKGATTFWETGLGAEDFGGAGSLCHAWSSIHVGFYGKRTLGVTPLEPGFKKFEVKPYPGNCTSASGEVPTPAGKIEISWRKNSDGTLDIDICHPHGLTPVTASYEEAPLGKITVTEK